LATLQPDLESHLSALLPDKLARGLSSQYLRLKKRAWTGDHEGVQEAAGKVAEHCLRAALHMAGQAVDLDKEIRNVAAQCSAMEQLPKASAPDSIRLVVPRAINLLYTLRNKRLGGHTVSEVDPSEMDALLAERLADWLVAELYRIGHATDLDQARALVSSLVSRRVPLVFSEEGFRRVLRADLAPEDELLLLLYASPEGATISNLARWSQIPRSTVERHIKRLEKLRLLRLDEGRPVRIYLLPSGQKAVEDRGLVSLN